MRATRSTSHARPDSTTPAPSSTGTNTLRLRAPEPGEGLRRLRGVVPEPAQHALVGWSGGWAVGHPVEASAEGRQPRRGRASRAGRPRRRGRSRRTTSARFHSHRYRYTKTYQPAAAITISERRQGQHPVRAHAATPVAAHAAPHSPASERCDVAGGAVDDAPRCRRRTARWRRASRRRSARRTRGRGSPGATGRCRSRRRARRGPGRIGAKPGSSVRTTSTSPGAGATSVPMCTGPVPRPPPAPAPGVAAGGCRPGRRCRRR